MKTIGIILCVHSQHGDQQANVPFFIENEDPFRNKRRTSTEAVV
jgi:hypothetical protein